MGKEITFLTAGELMDTEIPKERWVIQDLAMRGGVTTVSGNPGEGKTWFLLECGKCVIQGYPLFGIFTTEKGKVAYFNQENPRSVLQDRIQKLDYPREGLKLYHLQNLNIEKHFDEFLKIASRNDLLIFDSMIHFHNRNEDKAREMGIVMSRFKGIATEGDCAVILIHQNRKRKLFERDTIFSSRGSFQIIYDSDLTFSLRKVNQESVIECTKCRTGIQRPPFKFEINEVKDKVQLLYKGLYDEQELKSDKSRLLIPAILKDIGSPLPLEEIRITLRERGLDVSFPTLRPILRDLEDKKLISSETGGRGKKFYYFPEDKMSDDITGEETEDILWSF